MFPIEFAECDTAETLARVEAAHERQRRSELDLILLAQHYAHLHPAPTRDRGRGGGVPGGERARVYGGEGCPEIGEFAPAEFGVVTGVSPGSAARFIGQCVALPFRFPSTWERVKSGHATPWKARQIAQDCVNLSMEAAAIVDRRVADIIDAVSGQQLNSIKKAAIWEADPDAAKAKAEEEAKERGVWVGRSDDHGTTRLFVKAATGDIVALDATITELAAALAATGDTGTLDQRRAKAAGLLSDPELAADLLAAAQHLAAITESTPVDRASTNADPGSAIEAADHDPTEDDSADGPGTSEATNQTGLDNRGNSDDRDSIRDRDTTTIAADDEADRDAPHPSTPGHPLDDTTAPGVAFKPAAQQTSRNNPGNHADNHTDDRGGYSAHDRRPYGSDDRVAYGASERVNDDALMDDLTEPCLDDEADRDTPHPSTPDHPLDQDARPATPAEPPVERRSMLRPSPGPGEPSEPADDRARVGMDAAARLELRRRIDAVRRDHPDIRGRRVYQTVVNVHITDETLFAGAGTARVEGYGPVYTDRLEELLGHHRIVVRPVIDLNTPISVHSYEIPERIRDQVNLRYPVEQFPYGTGETRTTTNPTSTGRAATDLDHIKPYRPEDPSPQTNTDNLAPLRRFSHRLKTHADWDERRVNAYTLEWTSPHGYVFHVDHNGTRRAPNRNHRRRPRQSPDTGACWGDGMSV